jgi:hypothetical protein
MANSIFTLDKMDDFTEKINIDELYENKKNHDINQVSNYNKILNRIHKKIKLTSKQKMNDNMCWFLIPEVILGIPKYDQSGCIMYIYGKLKDNGFVVNYIHPNLLMISWAHFIPSYMRHELKKKTGIEIDEYGNKLSDAKNDDYDIGILQNEKNKNNIMNMANTVTTNDKSNKFIPISNYKPQGNLIYDESLLNTRNI